MADATGETEGTGLMSIEHRLLQSSHPDESSRYENCLYACRYCNGSRSTAPVQDARGRRLLDPSAMAWADHFHLDGDRLSYRAGDDDAAYTHETYDLDDRRKTKLRAERASRIAEGLETLRNGEQRIQRLLDIAASPELSAEVRGVLHDEIQELRALMARAKAHLRRRSAVPSNADHTCRCSSKERRKLPLALETQMLELDLS